MPCQHACPARLFTCPCICPTRLPAHLQGVGATPGCVRRRSRLAEMLLERDRVDDAEKLLRNILGYVESTQVGEADTGGVRRLAAGWSAKQMSCCGTA